MYEITQVSDFAAEAFEQLGTKRKFWFWDDQNQKWLFKEGRPGTGENWAEKVACELCSLLKIPHAKYDLAQWMEHDGVVTPTFVPEAGRLILGNELLPRFVANYDRAKKYKQKQHTIKRALILTNDSGLNPPRGFRRMANVKTSLDVFIGYLMLDAWIANQDRHYENWGFVLTSNNILYLAPTFDHASGFGRNETDRKREDKLTTTNSRGDMASYVKRAITPFYSTHTAEKSLSTIDAFKEAAKFNKVAALEWLDKLDSIDESDTLSVFHRIPGNLISEVAIEFAQKILQLNKERLLSLRETLS
ncbi:MAG: hypothetical protein OET90_05310 [Desulfuromonadales bacterium]|nr:hypothetical protein [Desulfuromonadales bacterium]